MNYRNCLPAAILSSLAIRSPLSGNELATLANVPAVRVRNVLPDLVKTGQIVREGRRKHYVYRLPASGFAEHIPADAAPVPDVVEFGAPPTPEEVVAMTDHTEPQPYTVAAALARLQAHAERLAQMASENSKLGDAVSPVRSEEPE